jgi:uncharacterized membrane protein
MRLLVLLFLLTPVLAVPVHQIDIDLSENSFVERIQLSDIGSLVNLELPPGDLQLLESNAQCELNHQLNCELSGDVLDVSILVRNARSVGYITSYEQGSMFRFSYTPAEPSQLKLRVILPQGAVFADDPSTFPQAEIKTDGQRLYAEWNLELDADEQTDFFILYSQPTNYLWILGVVLVAAGALLFTKARSIEKERVIKVLSENERKVYDFISSKGGEVNQKIIVKELGWSKSKISQLIRNLEEIDVVSKKIKGRKNLIKLKI